jgi:RNA polymerase sigma factor (sigma-70 family)
VDLDSCTVKDAKLHAAWRRRDPNAAADLVVRYRPRLIDFGEQLGLSRVDAEDLAHQVLLEAPSSPFEAREGATYFDWLSVIALRKASKVIARATGESPVRRQTTPRTGLWRNEVLESIEEMPEPLREVFLRLAAGYSGTEIASELRLLQSTVRVRIHRGRKWLRDRGL